MAWGTATSSIINLPWSGLQTTRILQTTSKSVVIDYSTSVNNIPYLCSARVVISQQARRVFFKCARENLRACNNRLSVQKQAVIITVQTKPLFSILKSIFHAKTLTFKKHLSNKKQMKGDL